MTVRADMTGDMRKKRGLSPLANTFCIIIFALLLIFSALLQCAGISMLGVTPDITFALVCAIGFVYGERYGGIFGLCGGVLIAALGSGGISLSPIMFTLCGYLCGALPEVILRRNFLSYLVYTPMMGAIHIFFTLIYYIMLSQSYEIWSVIGKRIIPEFFSCVVPMIMFYAVVIVIYKLFKGKRKYQ